MKIYKPMRFSYILFFLLVCASAFAQPSADAGKTIFRNYCATCHAKDMKTKSTGPALGGTQDRWAAYPKEDLYGWIRNSQGMVKKGHPRAVELFSEWKSVMTPWPNLTDDDIASVLLYIDETAKGGGATASTTSTTVATSDKADFKWVYYILFLLLAVLVIVLAQVILTLDSEADKVDGVNRAPKTLLQTIFSKRNLSFFIFAAVLIGGYTTVTRAINLGRQQGYQPTQPINFSHAKHAGDNKIDCNYCHDGARRSKQALIPATSTCLNCHSAIKVGSQFGTAELTKIYAAAGYDPSTAKYIENYDKLSPENIAAIYKKWIGDQYLVSSGLTALDDDGKKEVDDQWNNIVQSLTNGQKKNIQGSVEWVRVHNLPDHVYFNHSQHVTVGKVACQTCHGKVEEMAVVEQYSPLSMGWCVNCHRQTEVQFTSNPYYSTYVNYHEQLKNGKKVTVQDIGGLECQKCHY